MLGVVTESLTDSPTVEPLSPCSCQHQQQSSTNNPPEDTLVDLVDEIALRSKKRRGVACHRPTNKWSRAEVDILLKLINLYGTDFSMIAFRMRKSRDQIKRKYTVLERTHGSALQDIFGGKVERDEELQAFYHKLVREE